MALFSRLRSSKTGKEPTATIEWKSAIWRGAPSGLSIRDLLSALKGFGPMETIEFTRPGRCRGRISLGLTAEGTKEATIYDLEVCGEKRKGEGRAALLWLRKALDAELHVQDFGVGRSRDAPARSHLFWIKMFREGIVASVEGDVCCLHKEMSEAEIEQVEEHVKRIFACREPGTRDA